MTAEEVEARAAKQRAYDAGMLVSVVIEMSGEPGESLHHAFTTVLDNADTVRDVHIVVPSHCPPIHCADERDALSAKNVSLFVHAPTLDPSEIMCRALVRLLPDHTVPRKEWNALLADMMPDAQRRKWCCQESRWRRPRHYALSSEAILPASPSPLYGFLLVMTVLDRLRALVSGGHYYDGHAVRAQLLRREQRFGEPGTDVTLPRWSWWWWPWFLWVGTGISGSGAPGAGTRHPHSFTAVIKEHPHMGWAVWWPLGLLIYSAACVAVALLAPQQVALTAYAVHTCVVAWMTYSRYDMPYFFLYVLLLPLYVPLSLPAFIYARTSRTRP